MAINMNSLPTEKGSTFAIIPKGSYIAKIVKAEMKTPKSGGNDYFSAECDITDPASDTGMGKFWINLFESEANLPRYQLRRFIEALKLNIQGEFELKDLTKMVTNKSLVIDICPEDKPDPQRSVVDISAECFYPLDSKPADNTAEQEALADEIANVFEAPVADTQEPTPTKSASY